MWATTFAQMSWVAEKHGRTKFVSMQHHCSHFHVKSERWIASAKASLAHPVLSGVSTVDEQIIRRMEEIAKRSGGR
ncbi:aldo-keto reductase [Penicillium chermesinum]|uniref:Aldo-keto reductase n=1 Tax=Penicillium chermesinum TaxID=63820 RepID=A0A9W9PK74_9EURO|nr:aldo-keto reductase [Penicillium chermesinum]KAJ5246807.1 aldo-keto reductase [Penicillium chermesinum]